jgi:protein disulfide-isomerase A6
LTLESVVSILPNKPNMARGSILGLLAALLAVVRVDGIYTKNSPVLQVDAKSYDALIAQSNYTSVGLIP